MAKACKENPKKFWKHVKSKTGSFGGIGNITKTLDNNKMLKITDDAEKANAFVEYFSEVYTKEPLNNFDKLDLQHATNVMNDLVITTDTVHKKLLKLKIDKSPGPDMIHPRVLKEIADQIASALTYIFEFSMSVGDLPDNWKCSVIHKKGSKTCVSNYRPISLTCIICKILESIIRDHVMNYFITNKLFSSKQFGFIQARSTVLQLVNIMDKWTQCLESGGQIDVIYTDFEKAFDKVPHKRLLSKLTSYGVNTELVKWIEMFLCYRKHQVRINGKII